MKLKRDFPNSICRDFFSAMVGKKLGSGVARDVYESSMNAHQVIKIESEAFSFQNVREFDVYSAVQDTKHAKWFAPCVQISPGGIVLIQQRTQPITAEQFPDEIPAFFTDIKLANWGMYEGRPVCHDYGSHLLFEKGMTSRMQKVDKEWF